MYHLGVSISYLVPYNCKISHNTRPCAPTKFPTLYGHCNDVGRKITVSEVLNSLALVDIKIRFQTLNEWPWGMTLVVSGREVHTAGSLWVAMS